MKNERYYAHYGVDGFELYSEMDFDEKCKACEIDYPHHFTVFESLYFAKRYLRDEIDSDIERLKNMRKEVNTKIV